MRTEGESKRTESPLAVGQKVRGITSYALAPANMHAIPLGNIVAELIPPRAGSTGRDVCTPGVRIGGEHPLSM